MKPYIKEGDNLKVAVMELRLYAPWVHSLKEKRMVVKSLLGKIRSRYAVSAAETGEQDIHQTLVIGVAGIVAHAAQADSMMDDILAFVENSTEAEIVSVERENPPGDIGLSGDFFLYFMERAGMVRGRFLRIKELVLVYEYIRTGDKVGKVNIQTYRQNSPGDVSKLFTLLT